MSTATVASSQPWYRSLTRTQWNTLIAANLGWLFRRLRDLRAGDVGWCRASFVAGPVPVRTNSSLRRDRDCAHAPRLGRGRTSRRRDHRLSRPQARDDDRDFGYSILTGLSAFAWDWTSFAVTRFLVGLAIGSEWVTGASIVAELWPDKNSRQGRRSDAMWTGHRIFPGVAGLAFHQSARSRRLALHVLARRAARPADVVGSQVNPQSPTNGNAPTTNGSLRSNDSAAARL